MFRNESCEACEAAGWSISLNVKSSSLKNEQAQVAPYMKHARSDHSTKETQNPNASPKYEREQQHLPHQVPPLHLPIPPLSTFPIIKPLHHPANKPQPAHPPVHNVPEPLRHALHRLPVRAPDVPPAVHVPVARAPRLAVELPAALGPACVRCRGRERSAMGVEAVR